MTAHLLSFALTASALCASCSRRDDSLALQAKDPGFWQQEINLSDRFRPQVQDSLYTLLQMATCITLEQRITPVIYFHAVENRAVVAFLDARQDTLAKATLVNLVIAPKPKLVQHFSRRRTLEFYERNRRGLATIYHRDDYDVYRQRIIHMDSARLSW